jgi:hypothetical protein
MERPTGVTIIAVLQFIGAAVLVLVGIASALGMSVLGTMLGEARSGRTRSGNARQRRRAGGHHHVRFRQPVWFTRVWHVELTRLGTDCDHGARGTGSDWGRAGIFFRARPYECIWISVNRDSTGYQCGHTVVPELAGGEPRVQPAAVGFKQSRSVMRGREEL